MPQPRAVDYLQPDEPVRAQARRHPLSAVDGFLAMTIGWLILGFGFIVVTVTWLPGDAATYGWTALGLLSVLWVAGMINLHWRRATSLFIVTPERVYGSHGRLRFTLTQTTYDKVTDMHVHQSLFGRIWGYGTVKVQTAGTGLSLPGVKDPMAFKQVIEAQRADFLRVLVGERTPGVSKARAHKAAEVQWTGSPSPATLLGAGIASTIMLVLCIGFTVLAIFVSPGALVAAAGTFLVAAAIFFAAWIQFRYTAYDVTDQGVVLRKGWLSRRRVEATFAKVTDVSVTQDILARILGYGTITINTAGSNEAPVSFAGVAKPDEVKALIDAARQAA